MERREAMAMARDLHRKGSKAGEIAKALAERGYLSTRTGKPLTDAGVYFILARKSKAKKHDAAVSRTPKRSAELRTRRTGDRSMLEIVQRLLVNDRMGIDDRVAASTLLIESHLKQRR